MMAGIIDTLSVLYSHANKLGFRHGIPLIRIYPIRARRIAVVIPADNQTIVLKTLAFSF